MEAFEKLAEKESFPFMLEKRIKMHIEENSKRYDYRAEKRGLMESLPPTLKMEVMNHTHGEIIQTLRFFEGRDWNFIWTAIPLMKSIHFAKFEIIYREGDLSEEGKCLE